jgi:hypothetical protein
MRGNPVRDGMHVVTIDPYRIERWIADIVRSANTIEIDVLLAELDEVCCVLEAACERRTPRVHAALRR